MASRWKGTLTFLILAGGAIAAPFMMINKNVPALPEAEAMRASIMAGEPAHCCIRAEWAFDGVNDITDFQNDDVTFYLTLDGTKVFEKKFDALSGPINSFCFVTVFGERYKDKIAASAFIRFRGYTLSARHFSVSGNVLLGIPDSDGPEGVTLERR